MLHFNTSDITILGIEITRLSYDNTSLPDDCAGSSQEAELLDMFKYWPSTSNFTQMSMDLVGTPAFCG